VSRRQAGRWAQQDDQAAQQQAYQQQQAAPPPAPAGGGSSDTLTQLQQLGDLKAQGVLTEAEFEAQKAKILQGA
jgi:hypothetical protein